MALSPEDVIKKSFSATHLRRGYDETQVDDFLDEVVVELRRLISENDGLRSDLEDCRASRGLGGQDAPRVADAATAAPVAAIDDGELESLQAELAEQRARAEAAEAERDRLSAAAQVTDEPSGETAEPAAAADAAATQALEAEVEELRRQLAACEQSREEAARAAEQQTESVAAPQAAALVGGAAASSPQSESSSLISLAQRLHDEHVAEGQAEKVRLVQEGDTYRETVVAEADTKAQELMATGQQTHDRLVAEGQETHDRLVTEGQTKHDELVSEGEQKREQLITEGQNQHDELVSTGRTSHDTMVAEAEQEREGILTDLSARQSALNGQIAALHTQESDLRDKLRSFLSEQLQRIDGRPDEERTETDQPQQS